MQYSNTQQILQDDDFQAQVFNCRFVFFFFFYTYCSTGYTIHQFAVRKPYHVQQYFSTSTRTASSFCWYWQESTLMTMQTIRANYFSVDSASQRRFNHAMQGFEDVIKNDGGVNCSATLHNLTSSFSFSISPSSNVWKKNVQDHSGGSFQEMKCQTRGRHTDVRDDIRCHILIIYNPSQSAVCNTF